MSIKQTLYKSAVCLKRNSPTILTVIAAVGVVGTTVAAIKATPKAMKLLEKASDEKKWNRIFKAAEIGGTILLIPTMNYLFNMKFAKQICNFEKDYTFTTTPGRTLGSLFRRK